MHRKILVTIITLLVLGLGLSPIMIIAQETDATIEDQPETVIRDSEGLKLQLVRQTQHPNNKELYLDLVIYSLIESDRVQVTWTVNGVSELLSEPISVLSVKPNTIYKRQALIRPREFGVSTITVRVEAFEADGTFVSTATTNLASFDDGTLINKSNQYTLANILYILQFVFMVITALLGLVSLAFFAFYRYRKFIAKDERQL